VHCFQFEGSDRIQRRLVHLTVEDLKDKDSVVGLNEIGNVGKVKLRLKRFTAQIYKRIKRALVRIFLELLECSIV
jgi:hypothetical protein